MFGRLMETGRKAGRGPLVAIAALALALTMTVASSALAQDDSDGLTPGRQGGYFVSELIDSTYFIGPAEFLALDLPSSMRGASAVHVFGEVSVLGSGKRDIIVRLFRASDYQNWLKRRGGVNSKALWTSPRARNVKVDQTLPAGTPVVLLLDNGYSIRTPKRVRAQIQLHFGSGSPTDLVREVPPVPPAPQEGDIVPRENTDESVPPPPPPPTE